jgi:hypothetical protein
VPIPHPATAGDRARQEGANNDRSTWAIAHTPKSQCSSTADAPRRPRRHPDSCREHMKQTQFNLNYSRSKACTVATAHTPKRQCSSTADEPSRPRRHPDSCREHMKQTRLDLNCSRNKASTVATAHSPKSQGPSTAATPRGFCTHSGSCKEHSRFIGMGRMYKVLLNSGSSSCRNLYIQMFGRSGGGALRYSVPKRLLFLN